MNRIVPGVIGVLLTLSAAVTFTQGGQPPTLATDITAADVQAVITAPTGGGDRQMKVVDMGKYNVSVGVLRRGKTTPGAPVGAINHDARDRGVLHHLGLGDAAHGRDRGRRQAASRRRRDREEWRWAPSNQGTFRQAAQSRKVGPGDIVIIPPGVYHGFTDVADHVEYVSVRPDPDHVLPGRVRAPALEEVGAFRVRAAASCRRHTSEEL